LRTRFRHLRGKPISQKYGLPAARPSDRHRWFFSLDETRAFVRDSGREDGWQVSDERVLLGPQANRIGRAMCRWPNLSCARLIWRCSSPAGETATRRGAPVVRHLASPPRLAAVTVSEERFEYCRRSLR
jgi:hypothetical protein